RRQGRIDGALAEVDLAGFAGQRAERLSGGQKQRVALARTLLLDRPVLLLDEPLSALDEATAAGLRVLLQKLVREKRWHTLMVSHQAEDVAIADRVLVIEKGRLRPT